MSEQLKAAQYPAPDAAPWEDPRRGAPRSREEWDWQRRRAERLARAALRHAPAGGIFAQTLRSELASLALTERPRSLPRYADLPPQERAADAAEQAARLAAVRENALRVLASTRTRHPPKPPHPGRGPT